MICSVCGKQKDVNELRGKRSKLMPGMKLTLCNECHKEKREPRYVIVLYGRANGMESVSDYITKKRYVGSDILATELIS